MPRIGGAAQVDAAVRLVKPGMTGVLPTRAQGVVAISSLVARSGVGLRAEGFALERLGHLVWLVPTVLLSWHPGQGPSTRIATESANFRALLDDLSGAPWLEEIGAILTGYFATPEQVEAAAGFIDRVRERRPDTLVACDPVLGDAGALYVAEPIAAAIRDVLVPRADILTPNLFELGWLAGRPVDDEASAVATARALGLSCVIVTSVPGSVPGRIAALLVERGKPALRAEHARIPDPPPGTGDLFAAVLLSSLLHGKSLPEATRMAAAAVADAVRAAAAAGSDELLLAANQDCIVSPVAHVSISRSEEAVS